jgi:hypothetical protein
MPDAYPGEVDTATNVLWRRSQVTFGSSFPDHST